MATSTSRSSSSSSSPSSSREVADWGVADVVEFLKNESELEEFAPLFAQARVDGLTLMRMTIEDVVRMGVPSPIAPLLISRRDNLFAKVNLEKLKIDEEAAKVGEEGKKFQQERTTKGSCSKYSKLLQILGVSFTFICFASSVICALFSGVWLLTWLSFVYGGAYCLLVLVVWLIVACKKRNDKTSRHRRFTLVCALLHTAITKHTH